MQNDNSKAEFEQVLKDELDILDELRDGISTNTKDSGYTCAWRIVNYRLNADT